MKLSPILLSVLSFMAITKMHYLPPFSETFQGFERLRIVKDSVQLKWKPANLSHAKFNKNEAKDKFVAKDKQQ